MNYQYKIISVDEKERWIFIGNADPSESNAFINLVKAIQSDRNGELICVGEMQYKIEGDPFGLIYQWDSCFGSVVIYAYNEQKDAVLEFLQIYFIKLKLTLS